MAFKTNKPNMPSVIPNSIENSPKKINTDLFVITYGSFVAQIIKDYENDDEVNKQLDKIGYNIGIRLIDDLIARSLFGPNPILNKCIDLKETADIITKIGFKTYLNIVPQVLNWSVNTNGCQEFSLIFDNNPLSEYAELPEGEHSKLWFSNILCGIIRGALEMLQLETSVYFVQDILRGHSTNEIRIRFLRKTEDFIPQVDD